MKAFTNGKLKIEGDIDKALKMSDIFNAVKKSNSEKAAGTVSSEAENTKKNEK